MVVSHKTITIRSQGGDPSSCVIDCEGQARGFNLSAAHDGTTLEGITITGGSASAGAGLVGPDAPWGIIIARNCVFYRNTSSDAGGGVWSAGQPSFFDCKFVENHASTGGGFAGRWFNNASSSAYVFDGCEFTGNTVHWGAAGIYVQDICVRQSTIRGCTFTRNTSPSDGSVIELRNGSPRVEQCTFSDNGVSGGAVILSSGYVGQWSHPYLVGCILSFAAGGSAVLCEYDAAATLSCCDVYGNSGGDWAGCIADQAGQDGNLSTDPLFCDAEGGDYHLQDASPCAGDNNPECGLIGALPDDCGGPVPVLPVGWGRLKLMYR